VCFGCVHLAFLTRRSSDLIDQDSLGDCYFVATLAAIAGQTPERIEQAIDYNEDTGNFTVELYNGDEWVTVEVSQAEIQDNIARRSEEHTSELQSRENLVCR